MILLCMGLFSCEERHIDDNISSAVYIVKNGLQEEVIYDVEGTHEYSVYAYRSGLEGSAEVTLAIDETALNVYNVEHGTSYRILPESCYTVDALSKSITETKVPFVFTFDCDKMVALSSTADYSDVQDYVLPLTLSSETDDTPEADDKALRTVIIRPALNPMSYRLIVPGQGGVTVDNEYFNFQLRLETVVENNYNSDYDLKLNLDDLFGAEGYILTSSAEKFTPGVSEITFDVKILKSVVENLHQFSYVIKAEIAKIEDGFSVAGDTVSEWSFEPYHLYPFYDRANMVRLPKEEWTTKVTNSYPYGNDNSYPYNVLDGDFNSFWEPAWSAASMGSWTSASTTLPYWLIFDFSEEVEFVGYRFYQRNGKNNQLKNGSVEYSNDRENWVKAGEFEFANGSNGPHYFVHAPAKGKYMRLWLTSSYSGNTVSISEMDIYVKQ